MFFFHRISLECAQGGDPAGIADAQQSLADGDALRASGLSGDLKDFKNAVKRYKKALPKGRVFCPSARLTQSGKTMNPVCPGLLLCTYYPKPFNPTTTIEFALPQPSAVTLKVYDILGREVAILVDDELESGFHKVHFDAKVLPTGVYFYRVQAGKFVRTKKLILVK